MAPNILQRNLPQGRRLTRRHGSRGKLHLLWRHRLVLHRLQRLHQVVRHRLGPSTAKKLRERLQKLRVCRDWLADRSPQKPPKLTWLSTPKARQILEPLSPGLAEQLPVGPALIPHNL